MTYKDNIYEPPANSSLAPEAPDIDVSGPRKDVRSAAIAAFISAGITALVVLAAMNSGSEGLSLFNDPSNLVDVALVVLCGWGLLRFSRAAAVILFVYFLFSKIYLSIELGRPAGIGFGLVFLYFYWRGIRGAFAYHRLQREANPGRQPSRPLLLYMIGIPVAALLVIAMGFGLLTETTLVPSTEVVEGHELSQGDTDFLRDEVIGDSGETVRLFYSTGLITIHDEGNLLTERRVVSYERIDDELAVYSAEFPDILTAEFVTKGDLLNDSVLEIALAGGGSFLVFLSAENDGDERFLRELNAGIQAAQALR